MMESIRSVSESIKGRQRAWIEAGNGPVVVLLHGFPDAPTGFLPQIRALAEAGYRAIAPYSRGNAPSFIPDDDDYSPLALATDVVDLLDGIGIAKAAAVVGHDWGAIAAYCFAALAPERVERLVTLAVPHGRAAKPNLFWTGFVMTMQVPAITSRAIVLSKGALVEKGTHMVSPNWAFTKEDLIEAKRILGDPEYLYNATGVYRALRRWPIRRDASFKLMMKSIQIPSLCFAGIDDRAMDISCFRKMSKAFTASLELVELDRVGHFPHRECPDRLNAKLLTFLGSAAKHHDAKDVKAVKRRSKRATAT